MSTRDIADLQETIDSLREALRQDDWESCQIESDTGERAWLSRADAAETVTEAEKELMRMRKQLS